MRTGGSLPARPRRAVGVAIVHALPGRYRLADPRLRRAPERAEAARLALLGVPGVTQASASAVTGTALVRCAASVTASRLRAVLGAALGDPPRARSLSAAARAQPCEEPHAWHAMPAEAAAAALGCAPKRGLPPAEAAARLAAGGPNLLARTEGRSATAIFAEQLTSVPVALLGASAVVSIATGGLADAVAIGAVVLLNAGIATATERSAERTIRGLSEVTPAPVPAMRGGKRMLLPVAALVPGDLILLEPGILVPADARLIAATDLTVNESALTGESLPVTKDAAARVPVEAPLGERHGMVFRGTGVTGGSGLAIVTATGAATEIGRIQALLGAVRPPQTPIERQLGEVGRELMLVNGVICAAVGGIGLLRGQPWPEMLRSAISLAVAAVPEGLPAVATTTLALGIQDMRHRQILVRRLDAVETLGAVEVVCLDKTGTLTANRMATAALHLDGTLLAPAMFAGAHRGVAAALLETATLCSDVEEAADGLAGSPTETALVRAAQELGLDLARLRACWPREKAVSRAEGRKRMTTLHRGRGGALLAMKGDPAEVLALCTKRLTMSGEATLDAKAREAIMAANDRMAGQALRVLGVARRQGGGDPQDEEGLTWLGLAGLADPLRPGAAAAIHALHVAGIRTMMITGDQSATAYAIAKELGLPRDGEVRVLEAGALRDLPPEALAALAPQADVFARVSPSNKLQIVRALQASGRIVAMTGDGINDGPALRAAEIGIAMGGAGTDVAREVADIVLATDDLGGLIDAIELGRATYANIRKVLRYLVGTNASETMVMLGAAIVGLPAPLTPMQLLWLNLVSDPLPALALGLEAPEPDVLEQLPHDPRAPILSPTDFRRLLREGAVIGGAALASTFGAPPAATFHGLTLAQLAHAFLCRSETHGLFDRDGPPMNARLVGAIGICLALQAAAQGVGPLRRLLGLGPLGPAGFAATAATALVPLAVNGIISAASQRRRQQERPNA
ncbi:cation-transporting P-type ATPase [Roseomonas frigidaquae]|uniref:Cation-transporting P-type ATPase n=1 Tax=Falsiroseomonas frigidaquae TaxID=487318 RepID=A0ABX1F890_9PROT|nr:HAD-IC family P-type ATPase [Falsiroseomonas frigidaquae]NKE48603.1 cation-transporting P-type ATPase [Falsiroseomonas frigidaquae]